MRSRTPTTKPVGALRQDEDVLDTWFSSALWPFSTLGWPGETPERAAEWERVQRVRAERTCSSPASTSSSSGSRAWSWRRCTSPASVPFREVYINAIVRDAEGQKMSKSKGNTIDPLDLIDGIDLESLVKKSTASLLIPQVREKVEKRIRKEYPDGIAAGRRRCAALHVRRARDVRAHDQFRSQARRRLQEFLQQAVERGALRADELRKASTIAPARRWQPKTEAERWILTRLQRTLAEVEAHFTTYRFDLLAQALYEFTWNEFCDWFLELAKPALNGGDAAAADSTRRTLLIVLEALLRALHPIIPFITEEIWHEVAPKLGIAGDSDLDAGAIRARRISPADAAAEAEIEWLKAVLTQIRRIRSEMNIAPGSTIPLLFAGGNASDRARTAKFASADRVPRAHRIAALARRRRSGTRVGGRDRRRDETADSARRPDRPRRRKRAPRARDQAHRGRDREVEREARQVRAEYAGGGRRAGEAAARGFHDDACGIARAARERIAARAQDASDSALGLSPRDVAVRSWRKPEFVHLVAEPVRLRRSPSMTIGVSPDGACRSAIATSCDTTG